MPLECPFHLITTTNWRILVLPVSAGFGPLAVYCLSSSELSPC